jgi:short-subunit dehydrogenase
MKRAIIIGASSGIGKALVELLLAGGYTVGITARRTELLQSIQTANPGRVIIRTMDVKQTSVLETICDDLVSELGGLDLMIISAGTGEENKDLTYEIEERTILTNVTGFTCLADWSMRYFCRQRAGHLAAISSIAGIRGNGLVPAYNASKAFQINYLEGLRVYAFKIGYPITVTDIRPGFVNTDMAKGDGLFWVVPVEKAARQIYQAIQQKKKVVYISRRWRLIAFLLRILPFAIYRKL